MCEGHSHGGGAARTANHAVGDIISNLSKLGLALGLALAAVRAILQTGLVSYSLPAWTASLPGASSLLLVLAVVMFGRALVPNRGAASPKARAMAADQLRLSSGAQSVMAAEEAMAARLAEAVRFRTVSSNAKPGDEHYEAERAQKRDAVLGLHAFLAAKYPRTHAQLERHVINELSLVFVWKGSDESQMPYCATAHLDVVPCPERARWSVDPFAGVIKDGYVWGRGTIDLKNLVCGWMEAIESLLEAGFKPKRTLYLTFGHDEEVGGYEGAKIISEWLQSRLGRHPFEFLWDEGLFVIDRIIAGHKGPVAMICASEKGSLTVHLTVETEPGHSSAPPAESSIGILANAVARLERHPMPSHLDGPAQNVFTCLRTGFTPPLRLLMSNLWLTGGLIRRILTMKHRTATLVRTTTAVTVFNAGKKHNVLPGTARAVVNHRVHPGDTLDEVQEYDRRIINDPRVKIERGLTIEPSPVSSHTHPAYKTLESVVNAVYPKAGVAPGLFVANSDSRWYWDLAPQIYRFNPISIDRDDTNRFHGIDERISVRNYAEVVLFIRTFVQKTDARSAPRAKAGKHA